ncbi:MAG: UDP-glucuronic acid decarboxylase family protein [Planctomycetota bacterium]|nr:UDP-glucuronic acid decarboxylase family protein [Planctomycetota bacterium]
MAQRILVTGGAGFLGSHLSKRLLDEGHQVVCVDSFATSQEQTIAPLLDNPGFELIRHDIVEPLFLDNIDAIYNLACPAAPGHYQYNPVRTLKSSVVGIINMLGMAKAKGIRILHTSTSEVYGDPQVSPQREDYNGNVNPIGRRSCYDEGKRAAETLMYDYHRQHGVDIKIVRIFNTYGPHMHPFDGRVVSNFIRQALAGEDITVFGDGSQTRSFCYVSDMIEALVRMMNSPEDFHGPVNVGNPNERTIMELAQSIIELTGSQSKIVRKPLPPDDPTQRRPDLSLARERLDWEPVVPLEEGLGHTVAYLSGLDLSLWDPPTPFWEAPPLEA